MSYFKYPKYDTYDFLKQAFAEHHYRLSPHVKLFDLEDGIYAFQYDGFELDEHTYGLSNLVHEMAHFIEIEEHRLTLPNFGFTLGFPKPQKTNAFLLRELRVSAIETNIYDACGISWERYQHRLTKDLIDQVAMNFHAEYSDGETETFKWMMERVIEMKEDHDKSAHHILKEFRRRLALLDIIEQSQDAENYRLATPQRILKPARIDLIKLLQARRNQLWRRERLFKRYRDTARAEAFCHGEELPIYWPEL